jgi:hypothetical protein
MLSPNRPTAGLGLDSSVTWVSAEESLEDLPGASLEISAAGRSLSASPRDYLVRQTPGSALGYDIVEHSSDTYPGTRPSFRAYRIAAPPAGYDVRLRAAGAVDGSRSLRTVDPRGSGRCAFALLLPLILVAARLAAGAATRRATRRPVHRA